MRRQASHWAFRPTSRSSQKLCSRSAMIASASSNLLRRDEIAAMRQQRALFKTECVDRRQSPAAEAWRREAPARPPRDRPSPDRRRRSSSEAAARALALRIPRPSYVGAGTASRDAGGAQLRSLLNSPARTYRSVMDRSFASARVVRKLEAEPRTHELRQLAGRLLGRRSRRRARRSRARPRASRRSR